MNTTAKPGDQWPEYLLDYDALDAFAEQEAPQYSKRAPYPHTLIDSFLSDWVIDKLVSEFPEPDPAKQEFDKTTYVNKQPAQVNKVGIQAETFFTPFVRHLLWELNSQRFLHFLEKLTGIQNLLPDPNYRGGGLHQTKPGGLLQVHADFNKHPIYGYDRRLNVLIYANKGWQDDWGGELELWNKVPDKCMRRISPIAGRCVIFNTSSESWHGHPEPVKCPDGNTRKSVALYYYTIGRPPHEERPAHKVLWAFPERGKITPP